MFDFIVFIFLLFYIGCAYFCCFSRNLVVGYGSPPKDEFSPLILIAIIVCVVVPSGFTLAGSIFLIAKKVIQRTSTSLVRVSSM
jgi:hypothetical protein